MYCLLPLCLWPPDLKKSPKSRGAVRCHGLKDLSRILYELGVKLASAARDLHYAPTRARDQRALVLNVPQLSSRLVVGY